MTDEQRKNPQRVRRRSIAVQLQAALNAAEILDRADASELTISRIKLAQTRLIVLSKALNRERHDKLKRALAEVKRLTAENERLKHELAAKPAVQVTDIDLFLAEHAQTPMLDEEYKEE
jgi:hypothetical protein